MHNLIHFRIHLVPEEDGELLSCLVSSAEYLAQKAQKEAAENPAENREREASGEASASKKKKKKTNKQKKNNKNKKNKKRPQPERTEEAAAAAPVPVRKRRRYYQEYIWVSIRADLNSAWEQLMGGTKFRPKNSPYRWSIKNACDRIPMSKDAWVRMWSYFTSKLCSYTYLVHTSTLCTYL